MEEFALKLLAGNGVSSYAIWGIFLIGALKNFLGFLERKENKLWTVVEMLLEKQGREITETSSELKDVKIQLRETLIRVDECEADRLQLNKTVNEHLLHIRTNKRSDERTDMD